MTQFSYPEMVKRNFGFVNDEEQKRLKETPVFICGVGGMGGACLLSLIRAGLENVGIADIDTFEVSNLNRQVFATMKTIDVDKAEASILQIKDINPEAKVFNYGPKWLDQLDEILQKHKIVVNGTDDILSSVILYRKAREHGAVVIDAYTSPLPSVYVTSPNRQTPEERLNFETKGVPTSELKTRFTKDVENQCKFQEITHVLTHSSSIQNIDLQAAVEMVAGKRSRMSLSMMVITTGNLMAYQVFAALLDKKGLTDEKGYFFDAIKGKCERPLPEPLASLKMFIVKRYLKGLLK